MKKITFRYIDKYSHGEWQYQTCIVDSVKRCREIYGLDEDPDCYEYEILTVEDVDTTRKEI